MNTLTIGLACNVKPDGTHLNGKSSEFYAECDHIETIYALKKSLEVAGNQVIILDSTDPKAFINNLIKTRFDIIYNVAEGLNGESRESYVPALLEMLEIPYTASGVLTLAITLNKARAKEILHFHKIPTPNFVIFNDCKKMVLPKTMHYPLIAKPLYEGSSKGIRDSSVVRDEKELKSKIKELYDFLKEPILVEEFLEGDEFTVAILGNEDPIILPIVELNYDELPKDANKIYSFEAKWIWDVPEKPLEIFHCPGRITKKLELEIIDVVRKTYKTLDCKDWSRIDVRLDGDGVPNIIEVNPLPGILPNPEDNSCMPKAARAAGLSYDELINAPLLYACLRYGINHENKFLVELEKKLETIKNNKKS